MELSYIRMEGVFKKWWCIGLNNRGYQKTEYSLIIKIGSSVK